MSAFISGNTVRFFCNFYNFADQLVDPDDVSFSLYTSKTATLIEELPARAENRTDTGRYFMDAILPETPGKYIYEWRGFINGKPSLIREEITVKRNR